MVSRQVQVAVRAGGAVGERAGGAVGEQAVAVAAAKLFSDDCSVCSTSAITERTVEVCCARVGNGQWYYSSIETSCSEQMIVKLWCL